jgi:hypothetical protein
VEPITLAISAIAGVAASQIAKRLADIVSRRNKREKLIMEIPGQPKAVIEIPRGATDEEIEHQVLAVVDKEKERVAALAARGEERFGASR